MQAWRPQLLILVDSGDRVLYDMVVNLGAGPTMYV